jgi:hypothetical protein|tara:strand:+ start:1064 stop:1258 length:195 start_codon:yes stop_codon:yes gene_type:complete
MFDNCTIEYVYNIENKKCCIKITYPADSNGKVKIIGVPLNNENRHYQEILEWVAAGNTITDPGA